MKILIAGADGYIGTQLSQFLIKNGHEAIGVDTGFYREAWLYNGIEVQPQIITRDIRNINIDDLRGYDVLIHLADLSNDPMGELDEKNTYRVNHQAVVQLAQNAKNAGIKKFIYSSSCSVYGIATEDLVNEESIPNPQTAYAKCKLLVENDVEKLSDANFCVTFLRNATVYGFSPRMRFDLAVNNLCASAFVYNEIRLTSDGTPWRPFVHILDVCLAFKCVVEADSKDVNMQIYNVGNNNSNYRIRDISEIILKQFPTCKISYGEKSNDTRSYKVNFNKINTYLPGFSSKRTVEDGVKELKKIFESIKLSKDIFEFRAYTRVKELNFLIETGQIDSMLFWNN